MLASKRTTRCRITRSEQGDAHRARECSEMRHRTFRCQHHFVSAKKIQRFPQRSQLLEIRRFAEIRGQLLAKIPSAGKPRHRKASPFL